MLQLSTRVIRVSEIDTADKSYWLGTESQPGQTDIQVLMEAIGEFGLVNPPLLEPLNSGFYRIVCGFRRIEACKSLGWDTIKAQIAQAASCYELMRLAILDNRSHRALTVVEQAHAISRLTSHDEGLNIFNIKESTDALGHLLGIGPNVSLMRKICMISQLPDTVQDAIAAGVVSFEAATELSRLPHQDCLAFSALFQKLKLNQNKQKEIIARVVEISHREGLDPQTIIGSDEVVTIINNESLNSNEKGARLREHLTSRRFPAIAKAEKRHAAAVKMLALGDAMAITPSAGFESPVHNLRIQFSSRQDLLRASAKLAAIAEHPALDEVLEPFAAPPPDRDGDGDRSACGLAGDALK